MTSLPTGWSLMRISDIGEVRGGIQKQGKRRPIKNKYPFLRVANVLRGRLNLDEIHEVELFDGELERYRLESGDLLVVEGNGSPDQIGRAAMWDGSVPKCATSGLYTLSTAKIKAVQIPICSVDEQRRIVDILEDHLSRLDAAHRLVSLSKQKLSAIRRSALTSVIHRAARSTVPLAQLVERIEAGKSFGGASAPAAADQWGIIKVSAMTWGEFRSEENKAVPAEAIDHRNEIRPGDLLVSRANTTDYVGASVLVGQVRPRLLLSDKSLRVVPRDDVDSRWLWLALSSPAVRAQISAKATGTKDSMRNISQASLLSVDVPYVSPIGQMADVVRLTAYFDAIAGLTGSLNTAQRRHGTLERALLEAAFSGRLTGRAIDMDRIEEMVGV